MGGGQGGGQPRFTTASGGDACATTVPVEFAPTATAAKISAFLSEEGAQIERGPLPGGFYMVCLSKAEISDAERAKIVAKYTSEKAIFKRIMPK